MLILRVGSEDFPLTNWQRKMFRERSCLLGRRVSLFPQPGRVCHMPTFRCMIHSLARSSRTKSVSMMVVITEAAGHRRWWETIRSGSFRYFHRVHYSQGQAGCDSNRVCICIPRFAALRSELTPSGHHAVRGPQLTHAIDRSSVVVIKVPSKR